MYKNKKFFVILDNNRKLWFNCMDTAKILKYERPKDAISTHIPKRCLITYKNIDIKDKPTNSRYKSNSNFTNLEGLFYLTFSSRKKLAEDFRQWICENVLPQLFDEGFYFMKYKMDVVKGEIVSVKNEMGIMEDEINKIKEIWKDLEKSLVEYKKDLTEEKSAIFINNIMKQSSILIELLTKNNNLIVQNVGYKQQIDRLLIETSYWKSITDKYISAKKGYIYILKIIIIENGIEKTGYKIGMCEIMKNRMKSYRIGNATFYLIAYFPLEFQDPSTVESGIKTLLQSKVFRYKNEIYYNVDVDYLLKRIAIVIKLQSESAGLENQFDKVKVFKIKENYNEDSDFFDRFEEKLLDVKVDIKINDLDNTNCNDDDDEDAVYTSNSDISDNEEFIPSNK